MQDVIDAVTTVQETTTGDRVRMHTAPAVLDELDRALRVRVEAFVGRRPDELTLRIEEIERESDIERVLEINASVLALSGVALAGVTGRRRWLLVPAVVLGFLLQHGAQGWCPPVAVLRRIGVRTRQELDTEKYALKVLRGDYERWSRIGSAPSEPTGSSGWVRAQT